MFKIGDKVIMKYVKENDKFHLSKSNVKSHHNHIGKIVEILRNFEGNNYDVYVVKDLTDDSKNRNNAVPTGKIVYALGIAWRKDELELYNKNRRITNV